MKLEFNLNHPIPLLILSDGPDAKSGLARIGHDLAWLLSGMPEFKVGYLGRLAFGNANYPWAQYSFSAKDQWGEELIERAWDDLSQGRKGIILTIWDASRLLWFANPDGTEGKLRKFLESGKFERWGYFMQDSAGPNPSQLPLTATEVFSRYDRVLLASKWAYELTTKTIGLPDVDWIPHGINTSVFKPQDRAYARSGWGIGAADKIIGCVMANQQRKHWSTVFEAVAQMPSKPWLWVHTDSLVRHWNLNALAVEYGIGDRILHDGRELSDFDLSLRYSACDATVLISGGEGFGYPVAESLACGVPVVTGSYGASAELVPVSIKPVYSQVETIHNVRRAYYSSEMAEMMLEHLLNQEQQSVSGLADHLEWKKLGVVWKKWFKAGVAK